jgi:hypothetical protein
VPSPHLGGGRARARGAAGVGARPRAHRRQLTVPPHYRRARTRRSKSRTHAGSNTPSTRTLYRKHGSGSTPW